MTRSECLTLAAGLISNDRQNTYGPPRQSLSDIAGLWSIILGRLVTVEQVALMMTAVKIARLKASPDHADSWVDAVGYLAIGAELATHGDL
jgi:Domain of unknown function (DUF6378)